MRTHLFAFALFCLSSWTIPQALAEDSLDLNQPSISSPAHPDDHTWNFSQAIRTQRLQICSSAEGKHTIKTAVKKNSEDAIDEWYGYTAKGAFEFGLDKTTKHSGTNSAYVKSVVPKSKEFGNLQQAFVPNNYLGKRLRMSGWVKTKLTSGTAQLWIRVDGEWNNDATKPGTFDNMDDRPIKGTTDWTPYSLVVDVPETANHVAFGLMLIGTGKIWLDDVSFETVSKDVPLSGKYTTLTGCGKKEPANLNFEKD